MWVNNTLGQKMPLHEASSFEMFTMSALYYLGIALFIVVPAMTAFWAWSAYRRSKKVGFVLLALFSATPYVTYTLNKISFHIHREEIAKANAQRTDGSLVVERSISLPIYQLIFAAGVFYLYRAEKKSANQSPQTARSFGPRA